MRTTFCYFIACFIIFSQKPDYVLETFKSTHLINVNTIEQLYDHTMEFTIAHRFGDSYSGLKDLFGIDLGANIYFAMDFALTNDLQIGLSRYSYNKVYEFNTKYRVFRQSGNGSIPVSFSLFAATQYQSDETAGHEKIFFLQSLIARKFNRSFSIQFSPFINQRLEYKRGNLIIGSQFIYGVNFSGRYRLGKRQSIIMEWSKVLNKNEHNDNSPKDLKIGKIPSFSMALNIEAGGHTYQVIISNQPRINGIYSQLGTNSDLFKQHFYFGFNLTRLFEL